MSTNSNIGVLNKNGTVDAVYCHWDGYPSYNGKILTEHYITAKKIKRLIELGNISILASNIGKKHEFDKPNKNWCLFYGRDRGDKNVSHQTYSSVKDYENNHLEYNYLFKDKQWFVFNYNINKFTSVPNYNVDIRKLISSSNRWYPVDVILKLETAARHLRRV